MNMKGKPFDLYNNICNKNSMKIMYFTYGELP